MWVKWLGSAALIVLADRLSKAYVAASLELGERIPVLPVFSWVHLNNRGAAFSFLADGGGWQRWFFVALAIGFCTFLLYELNRLGPKPRGIDRLSGWGYAVILGGALGNLYDRVAHGFVVDFVLLHWGDYYFPAFNVADSAITIGAGLWLLAMLLEARARRSAPVA